MSEILASMTFDPIVPPPLAELSRIAAAMELGETACRHCDASVETIGHDGGVIRAVGVTHLQGCPDFVPDWPA